jgi:phosphatidylglycerophosphate synthase
MRIWIDARGSGWQQNVFHMTLLERLLRAISNAQKGLKKLKTAEKQLGYLVASEGILRSVARRHMVPTEIVVSMDEGAPEPSTIPPELLASLPVRFAPETGTLRERIRRAQQDAGDEPVLVFPADAVTDVRIFEHLCWFQGGSAAFVGDEGSDPSAALRLEAMLPEQGSGGEDDLLALARTEIDGGRVKRIETSEMSVWIAKLRRNLAPYIFRIRSEDDRRRVERFLFESNYKGSTDFMTRYAYPPLVWRALGPLTRHRVQPNTITSISIVACFAAVPFFAAGWWVTGLALAYVMSVLDSVDGKLARVTFTSSERGDVLDHGLDIVHPPFWYWAWAWGLSGGDPYSPVFVSSLYMAGFYIFDRILETVFKGITGTGIASWKPLDERMRTFISRRNVNLAVFTVALPLGLGVEAFYLIVAWQAFTVLFHLSRVVAVWQENPTSASK